MVTRATRGRPANPATLTSVVGGMLVGFDEQVMRNRARVEELVKYGTEYRAVAADGSIVRLGPPIGDMEPFPPAPARMPVDPA